MKRNLSVLADGTFDLVVIGGGIYGAFVAWEAVLRGLSVALVERGDFGSATSANSQKIVHGGFRYLQHADFKRMRESIRERTTLMRIAPHLVHPLPVLIPTCGHGMRGKEVLKFALSVYDLVSFDRNFVKDPQKKIPRGHLLPKKDVQTIIPNLPEDHLTGGGVFYDAQVYNSERLLLSILRSAEKAGACIANYVRVHGFMIEGNCIKGVEVEDVFTGERFTIRSRMVVNTSGPWVYQVLGLLKQFQASKNFPLVKSVNVVTRQLFKNYAVGIYGKRRYEDKDSILNKGSRLFFVTPWRNHSVVGTALSFYDRNPDDLRVTRNDVQSFLNDFNLAYPDAKLKPEDVLFVHKGFLPSSGLNSKTRDVQISKKYRILNHRQDGLEGIVSVIGVKYTTARDVAEKAIDHIFQIWGRKFSRSLSSATAVYGGEIERFEDFLKEGVRKDSSRIEENLIKRLLYNYGARYSEVLKYFNPSPGEPSSYAVLRAEVLHGIREEMVLKLSDIVLRRTELGSAGHPGTEALQICAKTMQEEMGWSLARMQQELEEVNKVYELWDE